MTAKIFNFLFHSDNSLYAWILLTGICGVAAIRIIQLVGAFVLLRINLAGLLLISGWMAFVLLVNGPVASPKYRLPMEPAFAVLTGAGWVRLRERGGKPERR